MRARHRLVVTGAQGSGKSTLARRLRDAYSGAGMDCVLLECIGQRIAGLGLPLGLHATAETFCAFAAEHLRRERVCDTTGTVVQDRCLLDLLAYCRALRAGKHLQAFVAEAARVSLSGAVILLTGLEEGLPPSTSTVETTEFRLMIESEIKSAAAELSVELTLLKGNLDARIRQALALLPATSS